MYKRYSPKKTRIIGITRTCSVNKGDLSNVNLKIMLWTFTYLPVSTEIKSFESNLNDVYLQYANNNNGL